LGEIKNMKILLVLNKYLNRGQSEFFDAPYYNFYIPLLELGHQVYLYDTIHGDNKPFMEIVDDFQPNLIFSILTGNPSITPHEPIDEIKKITQENKIKTFNWFCDDTWRFETFGKKICKYFSYCSTPEKKYISKYKEIGYNNILLGNWHCNQDLKFSSSKIFDVTFCGGQTQSRIDMFQKLANSGINLKYFYGLSYEDIMRAYGLSKIGLNLTTNDNDIDKKNQMKLRIFEVVASQSLLLTEYVDSIEEFFNVGKEIEVFYNIEEAQDKIKFYLQNDSARQKIANSGYERFKKQHTSKIRLSEIINQII